jgi:hypothetical protein
MQAAKQFVNPTLDRRAGYRRPANLAPTPADRGSGDAGGPIDVPT